MLFELGTRLLARHRLTIDRLIVDFSGLLRAASMSDQSVVLVGARTDPINIGCVYLGKKRVLQRWDLLLRVGCDPCTGNRTTNWQASEQSMQM